ncbi:hypothetical protein HB816_08795 [Listeria booriae]|uniref:hypothetical protein n=1 Tax=Listeria booriae TaxID=1552123 RepID=UPI00162751D0|nr:hypothetical protein [Listeria booriae]MBC1230540.1 hypothetical protein [Listeria booriae]
MKQFIVICKDAKDAWNEIDRVIKHRAAYVTNVDKVDITITLGDEQYIYRAPYSNLDGYRVNGWMLSDCFKSMVNTDRFERTVSKLMDRYSRTTV